MSTEHQHPSVKVNKTGKKESDSGETLKKRLISDDRELAKLFAEILERKTEDLVSKTEQYNASLAVKEAYIYVLEDANKKINTENSALKEMLNSINASKAYKASRQLAKIPMLHRAKAAMTASNKEGEAITSDNNDTEEKVKEEYFQEIGNNIPKVDDKIFLEKLYKVADFKEEKNEINALTVRFFQEDGGSFFGGGAERYLLDLKEVCDMIGASFRLYQYATYNWVRFIDGVPVIGICPTKNDLSHNNESLEKEMDELFDAVTGQNACVNIYSAFNIHVLKSKKNTIGISHGIFWDNPGDHYIREDAFWDTHKSLIDSARLCDKMLSVDTNTCNWFQTIDYNLGRRFKYIPNYVDTATFSPRANYLNNSNKIVILCPRRLYAPRGLYAVLDIVDDLFFQYENVELHFVGRGFEEDTKKVEEKMAQWPDRIRWYAKMPDEMNTVYQKADITVIPTMYSEGTSLSCLEAMSSGNAVIATRIGGLTDLIINEYNGMLVEPDSASIYRAIVDLINNPEKLANLKKNARESAKYFSKEKWKEAIARELKGYLKDGNEAGSVSSNKTLKLCLESISSIEKRDIQECISNYLKSGWFVYISCSDNMLKEYSWRRLQFIDTSDDIYFEFDKIMNESDIIG